MHPHAGTHIFGEFTETDGNVVQLLLGADSIRGVLDGMSNIDNFLLGPWI